MRFCAICLCTFVFLLGLTAPSTAKADWGQVVYVALMNTLEQSGSPDTTIYDAALPHVTAEQIGPGDARVHLKYIRTYKYTGPRPDTFPSFWISLSARVTGTVNGGAGDTAADSSANVFPKPPLDSNAPDNYDYHMPFISPLIDLFGLFGDNWLLEEHPVSDTVDMSIELQAHAHVSFEYPNGTAFSSAEGSNRMFPGSFEMLPPF